MHWMLQKSLSIPPYLSTSPNADECRADVEELVPRLSLTYDTLHSLIMGEPDYDVCTG